MQPRIIITGTANLQLLPFEVLTTKWSEEDARRMDAKLTPEERARADKDCRKFAVELLRRQAV